MRSALKRESAAERPRGLRLRFFSDIISELRKVTWPSLPETRYLTIIVIVVSVVVGALLGAIDKLFDLAIRGLLVR